MRADEGALTVLPRHVLCWKKKGEAVSEPRGTDALGATRWPARLETGAAVADDGNRAAEQAAMTAGGAGSATPSSIHGAAANRAAALDAAMRACGSYGSSAFGSCTGTGGGGLASGCGQRPLGVDTSAPGFALASEARVAAAHRGSRSGWGRDRGPGDRP